MYDHYFNLSAEPFRLSPDYKFCYDHEKYFKAKAYMAYAFMRAEGFVMITGAPGTGKTTLVGDIIASLADERATIGNLVSNQLEADDLLRMVAFAFGVDAEQAEKAVVLQRLTRRFLSVYREGGRCLLIVDEAQDLAPKALEELRLLTNLQQDGQPLLQIFLLGQPELRDLVHSPGLDQVLQRIVAASDLEPLGESETRAYVERRLSVVGWRNDPAISLPVFPIIHLFSGGVPRRINLICSRLFLHCCVEQRHQISVADARAVVKELQDEQLSTRNILNHEAFLEEDQFEQFMEIAEADEEDGTETSQDSELVGPSVVPPPYRESDCNSEEGADEAIIPASSDIETHAEEAVGPPEPEPEPEPDTGPAGDEVDGKVPAQEREEPEPGRKNEVVDAGRGQQAPRKSVRYFLFALFVTGLLAALTVVAGVMCDPVHSDCGPLAPVISSMLD